MGIQECLYLGNLDSLRDWGHAKDFVEAQWLMLQQEIPEDYVIATGIQYSVRDFVNAAAKELDMQILWQGKGKDEKGYLVDGLLSKNSASKNKEKRQCILQVDPSYYRPTEVDNLIGDATKSKQKLGWAPKVSFHELVAEMIQEDYKLAQREDLIKKFNL